MSQRAARRREAGVTFAGYSPRAALAFTSRCGQERGRIPERRIFHRGGRSPGPCFSCYANKVLGGFLCVLFCFVFHSSPTFQSYLVDSGSVVEHLSAPRLSIGFRPGFGMFNVHTFACVHASAQEDFHAAQKVLTGWKGLLQRHHHEKEQTASSRKL